MRWLMALVMVIGSAAAEGAQWCVDHDTSQLGFRGTQDGEPFDGEFRDFEASLRFDPEQPDAGRFDVMVRPASADTGNSRRDDTLHESAWFHTQAYPEARFTTTAIRAAGGEYAYKATGRLTIRERTREINLPFDWQVDGDKAAMEARVTLDRTAFGVGQGQWSDCSSVGCEVEVVVDLGLQRCDG